MNERVRELYEQAAKQYYADTGEPAMIQYIFAELLLQECMTICGAIQSAAEYKNMQDFAAGAAKCKEIIKRDFGVE